MEDTQESVVEEVQVDAEQSEEATQEATETPETVVNTEVDAPKANVGEAIKAEVSRREAQLQKQYNEQMEELRKENAYLDKQAQIYGYADRKEYKQAIDAHMAQQEVEREAQRMGVDPETYAQYFAPVNQQLTELQQKVQTYEQQFTAQQQEQQRNDHARQQWTELCEQYPNLAESAEVLKKGERPDWYTEQVEEMVGMGYKLVHAYELANKDKIFKQKEQETLARLTGRDSKQVLSSIDSPNTMTLNPADMTNAEIQAISERVRRGERITL